MIILLTFLGLQLIPANSLNRSVIFTGPVHVIENQMEQFICSLNTREDFQNISVKHSNSEILFWTNLNEKCSVSKDFKNYLSNCTKDSGMLSYEMAFIQAFEGKITCQIEINNERYDRNINVFVNASSPIFNSTERLIYYENETFSFSCQSVNKKTNVMIINYIVYANGIQEDLNYASTNSSLITITQLNLNQTLHDASIGCGIQYEFSRYNQNFTKLNISYEMKRIEFYPKRDVYNPTDIIRCYSDGNPTPTVEWQLITTDFDDLINGSRLRIGNVLGNRTCNCRAQQNFKNQTILLSTQFVIVVKAFQSTVPTTMTTERWRNIKIEFSGDKLSKSNISEHRWEIVPKWAGFINGTITVKSTHIIRFNHTNIIEHSDFIYDTNVTFSSLSYRITDSATYGEYTCRMYNRYNETISASTYFIQGQNPNITMVKEGENFIINCSTTTLGSPKGIMMIFKRTKMGPLVNYSPFNISSLYIIVVANFNWKDDGDRALCIIKNEFYTWESQEIPINILYSVRDIKITPKREEYRNGDTVRCEAAGNPSPNITWWSTQNDSFIISSFPDTIKLTPPSDTFVEYFCVALNVINGVTNSIAKNIYINETYKEFVNFSVNPPAVGLEKMVTVECRVDNMNATSVLNIEDNDQLIVSVTQGSSSIQINYKNRTLNYNQDSKSVRFEMNLLNDGPRNLSCYVTFLSGTKLQKNVYLKQSLEIKYGNITREGEYFNVSCLQNVGNNLSITLNLVGSQNWKSLQLISVLSEPVTFPVLVSAIYHQAQFYCSLHMNSTELSRSVGEKLFVYYLSNLVTIVPENTDYSISEIIQCSAEGRPTPKIQWTSVTPSTGIQITNNNLILSSANGEYQYKCSAEVQYKTELMSVSKTIKFRVGKASGYLRLCLMNFTLVLMAIAFPSF